MVSTTISTFSSDQSLNFAARSFVFGASRSKRLDDDEPLLTHELGEHRAQRAAIHLAIHFLREAARLRRERHAAADPDGAAARAGARLARALLRMRLLAAAANFGLALLRLGAGTASRHVRRDHLVHERFIEFAPEGFIGNLQSPCQCHRRVSISWFVIRPRLLLDGRAPDAQRLACRPDRRPHEDIAAFGSGHRATDEEEVALEIDLDDLRFSVVTRSTPMWPDMRLPRNTRPGV